MPFGGNVDTLVQDFRELAAIGHQFKVLEYDYDLISGNVHYLYYQRGRSDQFTYHYNYDKLNRLIEVFSSEIETDHSRSNLWRHDAAYTYYDHGPLRRTLLGQDELQGLDYAYTLQGWIKGVNGSLEDNYAELTRPDMNLDGFRNARYSLGWINRRDLYRYANQYFDGDYKPIGGGAITPMEIALPAAYELFNGNIVRHFKSSIVDNYHTSALVGEYDQLNRVRYGNQELYGDRPAQNGGEANGTAAATPSYLTKAVEAPSYDGNGNILHLDRWFRAEQPEATQTGANNSLSYDYTPGTNLLGRVTGRVASDRSLTDNWQPFTFLTGDHRYTYDKSGNLIREENSEQPQRDVVIEWNPYGKVSTVQTADKNISIDRQYRTTFGYGPDQNRWAKRRLTAAPGVRSDAVASTYYVRDAQGSTLAVYGREQDYDQASGTTLDVQPFTLRQQYLFGSSRLGEVSFDRPVDAQAGPPVAYGTRQYELTNHLGNVTTVFSEHLREYTDYRGISFLSPEVVGHQDYLAFGLNLERSSASGGLDYRYGFNGKEIDDDGEWGEGTTAYDYGFRIYNPGIARFLRVDPLAEAMPSSSPDSYSFNNPVTVTDPDGRMPSDCCGGDPPFSVAGILYEGYQNARASIFNMEMREVEPVHRYGEWCYSNGELTTMMMVPYPPVIRLQLVRRFLRV